MDPIAGHYIRTLDYDSADIRVTALEDGRYHIAGLALWGTDRPAPHTGELDFIASLDGDRIEYSCPNGDRTYLAVLRFFDGKLTVTETNPIGIFGMNVYFEGEYEKAT